MVGFVALCLWASANWLTADLLPERMAPVAGEGFRLLLIGVLGMVVATLRREGGWVRTWWVSVVGIGLVGGPLLLMASAQGMAPGILGIVAFGMVPLVVMTVQGRMETLPSGVLGMAGMLVLLPVAVSYSGRQWVGMGLMVAAAVVTGGGLVTMHGVMRGRGVARAVGAVGMGSGMFLMAVGTLTGPVGWSWAAAAGEAARALVVDLPEVVLLVWLLREAEPLAVAARYLVAPMLTVLEGAVFLRAGIGVRMLIGLAMLSGGAYGLLRPKVDEAPVGLGLR